MSVSWVVRLVPESLEAGELAGESELVATGERAAFRSTAELVEICRRQLATAGHVVLPDARDAAVIPLQSTHPDRLQGGLS